MKRRNVQQAFIGEPNPNQEGLAVQSEGEDAVEIDLRGGRVMVTIPAATPDDQVLQHQGYLSGELQLEDGRTLSFEIQDGAVGAQWNVLDEQKIKQADEPTREGVGLSTLEPPGGV
jgi:hypothetical protein